MFIDQVKIYVRAGKGGSGCQSLYRNRFNRYGIPDGGDGGKGADIIIQADKSLNTLLDFKYKSNFQGLNGVHGSGKNKKGRDAESLIIRVPPGTIIRDARTDCVLRDLDRDGVRVVVARGGEGGSGNRRRKEAKPGLPGEEKELILDLKIIADVGLVGFPNCGKSTLISAISSAHPKIAAYPFTTKVPVLGVVKHADFSFIIADIPGLIAGSHQGKGLGDRFLRHIERTKIILQLIDIASTEGRDPIDDYKQINQELRLYGQKILEKPRIIVANKMDLENAKDNLKEFSKHLNQEIYPISALKQEGLEELIEALSRTLQKIGN